MHRPRRRTLRERLGAWWLAVRLRVESLPLYVFLGASALLGVDGFGMLLSMLPVFPTMVPLILVGSAVVYGLYRLLRWRRRKRD